MISIHAYNMLCCDDEANDAECHSAGDGHWLFHGVEVEEDFWLLQDKTPANVDKSMKLNKRQHGIQASRARCFEFE